MTFYVSYTLMCPRSPFYALRERKTVKHWALPDKRNLKNCATEVSFVIICVFTVWLNIGGRTRIDTREGHL